MQGLVYGVKATSAVGCSGSFVDVYTSLSFSDGRMMTILSPWWRYWLVYFCRTIHYCPLDSCIETSWDLEYHGISWISDFVWVHFGSHLLSPPWSMRSMRLRIGPPLSKSTVDLPYSSIIFDRHAPFPRCAFVAGRCRCCRCCRCCEGRRFHFFLLQIFAQNKTHSLSTGILGRRGSFGTVQRPWGLAKNMQKPSARCKKHLLAIWKPSEVSNVFKRVKPC